MEKRKKERPSAAQAKKAGRARRPYLPPAIEEIASIEQLAAACTKPSPGSQCGFPPNLIQKTS